MSSWIKSLILFGLAGVLGYFGVQAAIPRVLMEVAVKMTSKRGAINSMAYGALSTPENEPIVRPSPDLAYSSCPFDVSQGPVRVDVVPVPGRYSSLSIFDAQTDVVFVRNDLQAGGKPYSVIIARDGQMTPPGAEVVRVGHDRGIALIRLLLANPAEIGALDAVRHQSGCHALGS